MEGVINQDSNKMEEEEDAKKATNHEVFFDDKFPIEKRAAATEILIKEHCPLAADLTKVRPAQQLHCSSISSVGRKLGGRKVVSEGIGELVFSAS